HRDRRGPAGRLAQALRELYRRRQEPGRNSVRRGIMKAIQAIVVAALAALAAPSLAQAETTLNVGVVSRTVFYLPVWTAIAQGFFKQEGLDVHIEADDGSDKISDDLRAGTKQIGILSIENLIGEAYKGGKLKVIAATAQRPPHLIIAQPEIKSLADLKDKTIGVVSMKEGTTFFV